MIRSRSFALLGAVVLFLAGCTGQTQSTPSPSAPASSPPSSSPTLPDAPPEPVDVSVMLDFYPDAIYAPLQRGVELGYFEEEGVNLEILPSSGSSLTLQELRSGNVDFAFASLSTYVADRAENGTGTMAIYAYFNAPTVGIVATFPLDEPEDLVGKHFGTVPFSAGRIQLPYVLEANAVDPASVTIDLMDFSVLYATLFEGGIDAAELHQPGDEGVLAEAEAQGRTVYAKRLAEWGYRDYSKTLLASDSVIAERPEVVGRLVRAIDRSLGDALANATDDEIFEAMRALDEQAEAEAVAATWANVKRYVDGKPGPFSDEVVGYVLDLQESSAGPNDLRAADVYTAEFVP